MFCAYGQVAINADNSQPDSSAGLDVKFLDKGFLPPRMTTNQMNAIAGPAEGLMLYNTSIHCLVYYSNEGWRAFNGRHFIGEGFGGGIVFYLDSTGEHGLVAAATDQPMAEWGCWPFPLPGTSTEFGTGQANTTLIVNGCPTLNIAAKVCDDLVLNGFSDWFLPSRDELVEMYNQRMVIGGFVPSFYWSSSEHGDGTAWSESFEYGFNYGRSKYDVSYVRAIRDF
jgi:hypothetical protein